MLLSIKCLLDYQEGRGALMVEKIFDYLPIVVSPVVLFLFSLVSAYVFKFGIRNTGIHFDYVIFSIITVAALVLGGAV